MVALSLEPVYSRSSSASYASARESLQRPLTSSYGRPSLTTSTEPRRRFEDVPSLQRRIKGEKEELEESKVALKRMGRTLDVYRQRLCSLLGIEHDVPAVSSSAPPSSLGIAQRAREMVRSMEADVLRGGRSDLELGVAEVSSTAPRSCGVLRQSLEEAQRRCKSLSGDMVQQTQTNEELVEALATVKDANKRLLEQIRFQTDEISQLTEQRILNEERIAALEEKQKGEREAFALELKRRIEEFRERAGGQQRNMQMSLEEQQRLFQARLKIAAEDAASAAGRQERLQSEAVALMNGFQAQIEAVLKECTKRCNALQRQHTEEAEALKKSIEELEKRQAAEREEFQGEALRWSNKHSALSADAEDVRSRTMRDVAQFGSQLQALERVLAVERQAWSLERGSAEDSIDQSSALLRKREEELESLQCSIQRHEAALTAEGLEIRRREQDVESLQAEVRESEGALAAATSGNEHLRKQLEEQRKRFDEKNELDVASVESAHESKLSESKSIAEVSSSSKLRLLRAFEERLHADEEALRATMAQLKLAEEDIADLQDDVAQRRAQHEATKAARQDLEKSLAETRQSAALERLQLVEEHETLAANAAAAGDDVARITQGLSDFRRAAGAREANHGTKSTAAEAALRDLREQLLAMKKKLAETSEARFKAEEEAASSRAHGQEAVAALEAKMNETKRTQKEVRGNLHKALEEEERGTAQARKDFEGERESGLALLRRAQDESRTKLGAAESDQLRIAEHCKTEIAEASEQSSALQARAEFLEKELGNLRQQLAQQEHNRAFMRSEAEEAEKESASSMHIISENLRNMKASLEKAVREESSLTRQLEGAMTRQNLEQRKLAKELEAVRSSAAREGLDLQERLRRARSSDGLRRGVSLLDAEPRFLASQSHCSAGLTSLHSKLENHIQRLQKHTEELRGSLHANNWQAEGRPAEPLAWEGQSLLSGSIFS